MNLMFKGLNQFRSTCAFTDKIWYISDTVYSRGTGVTILNSIASNEVELKPYL